MYSNHWITNFPQNLTVEKNLKIGHYLARYMNKNSQPTFLVHPVGGLAFQLRPCTNLERTLAKSRLSLVVKHFDHAISCRPTSSIFAIWHKTLISCRSLCTDTVLQSESNPCGKIAAIIRVSTSLGLMAIHSVTQCVTCYRSIQHYINLQSGDIVTPSVWHIIVTEPFSTLSCRGDTQGHAGSATNSTLLWNGPCDPHA